MLKINKKYDNYREAELRRRDEEKKKTRRPSRFEVTPAPDMLQVPGTGMTRGTSLTTQDQGGLIPGKIIHLEKYLYIIITSR